MKTKHLFILLLTWVLVMQASVGGLAGPPVVIQCSVPFSIRNAGLEVQGTLAGVEADIAFHPSDLARSHITATADPATLQTGIGLRDKHLQGPDYFDAKTHPCIRLRSKAFRKTGKDAFNGWFEVTIKGVTKETSIPFTVRRVGVSTEYRGNFELDRLDFNLGEESPILDRKVRIFITLNLRDDSPGS